MLITIYNIYVESVVFVRKNIFVVVPFVLFQIVCFLLNIWTRNDTTFARFTYQFIYFLSFCLATVFVVVAVYKREAIIRNEETILQAAWRSYGSVVLLILYTVFDILVLGFAVSLLFKILDFPDAGKEILVSLVIAAFFVSFPLSLRHMIYHGKIFVSDSIKAGFVELYMHPLFYLCIFLSGVVMSLFPSLLSPVSWSVLPFMPIVEWTGARQINAINWFGVLLYPFVSAVVEVSLTYAFILKNKNPVIS